MQTYTSPEHRQGTATQNMVEEQLIRMPPNFFVWASLGSMVASLILQLMGMKERSLFIGQWAPTFLIMAIYNRVMKVEERERS